ncbi:MAG TPA: ABC transporter substrate-binding protein [Candidatus Limnocylindria bacterium]|nr:ABC transporter substrate-binding protein [Candidatus Limnocylindria bacterium]
MNTNTRGHLSVALRNVAIGLAALLAACTATPGTGTGGDSTGNTTGIKDKSIVVGISSPESGPGAIAAGYTYGFKTYLDYRSQGTGINGYKFQSVIVDNLGNAAGGAQSMQQLLARTPFMVLITGSSSIQGAAPVISSQGNGVVVLGLGNADILQASGLPNTYGFFPHYTQECYFMADFAIKTLKAKSLALVYEDSATGQGAAITCPTYSLTHGGAAFKNFPFPPPAVSTNYTSLVASIKDTSPEACMFMGSAAEIASVKKAADAVGVTCKWIGFSPLFDPTYIDLAGASAEGTYFDAFVEPVGSDSDATKLLKTEMQKSAPTHINQFGAFGWSFAAVIADAVERATAGGKTLTRESFTSAMNSTKTTKQLGLLYSADYTGDRYTLTRSMTVYQVQGGKFVKVLDTTSIPQP